MRPNCQKMECFASGEVQHPGYLKTLFADAARCVPTVGCLRFSLTAHPLIVFTFPFLCEIKDKSDFVFHAKSAKSAEIYSLSCFTLALESTEWHSFHCASQTNGNLKSETYRSSAPRSPFNQLESTETRRIRDFGRFVFLGIKQTCLFSSQEN
jgi:hypothetical protein